MTKTRVLIVDDDASMVRYLSTYLARHNFDVNTVDSGEEAIRMFRVHDPQLVLLDVGMGGMTGFETLERIKQIKPDVSVIMVSGQNNPELIFRASKLGADDYISKPFDPKELDARIAKVLGQQRVVSGVTQQVRSRARRASKGTSPWLGESSV
jgi:DNA-binding response OmpR family regulator